ncbi:MULTISPECIES: 4'-phosphopantetheinyl transferase family protein [Streptomyces]|uniref:4'-phosphopantetheinyl transferase family protein n=1 Tax=Streptomyces lienomycini TaxID=284035 RepID=A0ABV9WT71_9ACTN|nr:MULTISPECIES: 4'-phosphopantetheinyl transferase superfamily protein [Streptomyces]
MRAIRVSWTETAWPGSGTPLPGGGTVTVEWLPIEQVRGDYAAAPAAYPAHYLAPPELPVLTRIAVPKRRVEWLAGRVAAKRLVCLALERAGVPVLPGELAVLGNKPGGRAGKPELTWCAPGLADRAGRHVTDISLAHTLRFAVCAVARGGRVGVDLEPLRGFGPVLRRTVFTDHESALAESVFPAFDTGHRGAALWVVKEALLKAYGIGFAHGWGTARLRAATEDAGVFDITLPAGADPGHRVAVRYGRVTDHIFAIASVAPRPPDGHQQKGQLRAWD